MEHLRSKSDFCKQTVILLAVIIIVILCTGNSALSLEYYLYRNDFDRAAETNESLFSRKMINRDQYILNKAFIELFKGNINDSCMIFNLYEGDHDISRREILAMLYFCREDEFIKTVDEYENKERLNPFYYGIYLFEKGFFNKAVSSFQRMNINRLSGMEYRTYLKYYMAILAQANDIKGIAELFAGTGSINILESNLIKDINLLRELSFYDIPHREEIINIVLKYYYDNNLINEGISYIGRLYRGRVVTPDSFREIRKYFQEKPLVILINTAELSEEASFKLKEGMDKFFKTAGMNAQIIHNDTSTVRYEIIDSINRGSMKNRFYIPVTSLFDDYQSNVIFPVITLIDKVESLLEHAGDIKNDKTLVILRSWDEKVPVFDLIAQPVYKVADFDYVSLSESESENIEFIIIDGSAEEIFVLLNSINLISFESLKQIYVLNDMGSYRPRLKGFRYKGLLLHIPVFNRIKEILDKGDLDNYDRYSFLGYDIAGIIHMVEAKRETFRGLLADYSVSSGRIKKRIKYERLF